MTPSEDPNETAGQSVTAVSLRQRKFELTKPSNEYRADQDGWLIHHFDGEEFITNFQKLNEIARIDRKLIEIGAVSQGKGIDLRAADPDTNNKGTNTSQSSAQGKE